MDRSRVAIVIPAFNEAATIHAVVTSASAYGQPIVVNDCSVDNTANEAKAAGAVVVNHTINQGYDGALNSGFAEAVSRKFDFIITLDADGQHDPTLLVSFVDKLVNGSKLVLGVRSSKARLAERIFAMYTYIRFGVKDPLCGMKGYTREAYEKVGYFDSYKSIGTELMLRSLSSGFKYEQVNFVVRDRADSPRFGRLIFANFLILRSLFVWLFK